jgi:hypothetical protein
MSQGWPRGMDPNMLKEISCRLIMCCLAVIGSKCLSPAQVLGTVVSAHGSWCDESQKPCAALWRMYPVRKQSKLVRMPPFNGRESVTIRSRWGVKETFDCANPRELGCREPLDLSRIIAQEQQKNVITAFLDVVSELAEDRPEVYETFREGILQIRGSDRHVLSDGVAKLTVHGLSLDNILARFDTGNYLLELCALSETGAPKCSDQSAPFNYSWHAENSAAYPGSAVHPGIYRLYRWDNESGTPRRTRQYADVLIAENTRYQTVLNQFRQVVEATRNWDADDSTAPALRRAYLYTLSRH